MEYKKFTEKYIEKQWKLILSVFGGVALLGAAWALLGTQSLTKEKQAQEKYFIIEKKLLELKAKQAPAENPLEKIDPKKQTKKTKKVNSFFIIHV